MSTIAIKLARRVGRAVRTRREHAKLTIRGLAAKSGVSSSMISDIERGAKSPTISTLAVLAAALGTPIRALVETPAATARRIRVVRGARRRTRIDRGTGAARQDFGPAIAGSRVEFLRYVVPP